MGLPILFVILLIEFFFIYIFYRYDKEQFFGFIAFCTILLYCIVFLVYSNINGMIQISNGTYELNLAISSLHKEIEERYNYKNELGPMDPDFDLEKKQIMLQDMYKCKYGN